MLATHCLFMSFLLQARHAIYVTVEPPAEWTCLVRRPLEALSRKSGSADLTQIRHEVSRKPLPWIRVRNAGSGAIHQSGLRGEATKQVLVECRREARAAGHSATEAIRAAWNGGHAALGLSGSFMGLRRRKRRKPVDGVKDSAPECCLRRMSSWDAPRAARVNCLGFCLRYSHGGKPMERRIPGARAAFPPARPRAGAMGR